MDFFLPPIWRKRTGKFNVILEERTSGVNGYLIKFTFNADNSGLVVYKKIIIVRVRSVIILSSRQLSVWFHIGTFYYFRFHPDSRGTNLRLTMLTEIWYGTGRLFQLAVVALMFRRRRRRRSHACRSRRRRRRRYDRPGRHAKVRNFGLEHDGGSLHGHHQQIPRCHTVVTITTTSTTSTRKELAGRMKVKLDAV
jgi:hypothetical protein